MQGITQDVKNVVIFGKIGEKNRRGVKLHVYVVDLLFQGFT